MGKMLNGGKEKMIRKGIERKKTHKERSKR